MSCPDFWENDEIFKDLIQTVVYHTSFALFLDILLKTKQIKLLNEKKKKKKALKMTSQLVIFRAFLFIFFRPSDPKSEKKIPVIQLIKKFWPKLSCYAYATMLCMIQVHFLQDIIKKDQNE